METTGNLDAVNWKTEKLNLKIKNSKTNQPLEIVQIYLSWYRPLSLSSSPWKKFREKVLVYLCICIFLQKNKKCVLQKNKTGILQADRV